MILICKPQDVVHARARAHGRARKHTHTTHTHVRTNTQHTHTHTHEHLRARARISRPQNPSKSPSVYLATATELRLRLPAPPLPLELEPPLASETPNHVKEDMALPDDDEADGELARLRAMRHDCAAVWHTATDAPDRSEELLDVVWALLPNRDIEGARWQSSPHMLSS